MTASASPWRPASCSASSASPAPARPRSGKTTIALALLGFANPGLVICGGRVLVAGEPMLGGTEADTRRRRSRLISYVPQDPGQALNPARRIGRQLDEIVRVHDPGRDPKRAVARALERARLPADRPFLRRYPHQLSGGQRQRVVIAQALLLEPAVVVLDEPTTGLDAATRRELVAHLDALRTETGTAMVYVTHDLATIAACADRIAVLHAGRIVEPGPVSTVHTGPQRIVGEAATVLDVRGLTATHHSGRNTIVAAESVDLAIGAGECVALVGRSGAGKTTIGRCVAGLHIPDAGTIMLDGVAIAASARRRTLEQRRRIQLIYQSPAESLNPRRTIGAEIARVLRFHNTAGDVGELMDSVRLPRPLAARRPGQLSGGEQQRAAIARALAANPSVLVCDEITAALDAGVQAAVLDTLTALRREFGLAILLISHDLAVVAAVADRVVPIAPATEMV